MAVDAVDTDQLRNNIVTLAKATNDLRLHQFVGEETEVYTTDTAWEAAKVASFLKHPLSPLTDLRFFGSIKTAVEGATGFIGVFIDEEGSPRFEGATAEVAYNLVNGEFDVTDLSAGRHQLTVSLKAGVAGVTVSNDHMDVMYVK
jgi:hypothetical protein